MSTENGNHFDQNFMLMIGGLVSDIASIRNNVNSIDAKTDKLVETTIEIRSQAAAAHSRLDGLEPKVEATTAFKNKQLGIVGTISFAVSMIGVGLAKVLAVF